MLLLLTLNIQFLEKYFIHRDKYLMYNVHYLNTFNYTDINDEKYENVCTLVGVSVAIYYTLVTAARDTYDGETLGLLGLLLLLDLVLGDHVHTVALLHHAAVVLTHGTYTLQPATRQLYRVPVCSYPTYVIGTFS